MTSDLFSNVTATTLLINTRSRRGQALIPHAERLFGSCGVAVTTLPVHSPAQAELVLQAEVARGAPMVIVGGGDGTLSHAAGLLAGSETGLGVLPLGTGNTFARSVGVPLNVEGAVGVIAGRHRVSIDVGRANGRVFLNSLALGWSAEIARSLTADVKRRLGLLAWPLVGVRALINHRLLDLDLTVDGRTSRLLTHQLLVANGRYVAGPLRVDPEASVTDRRLDVLTLGDERLPSLLWAGVGWVLGRREARATSREVRIVSRQGPLNVSIDGEVTRASEWSLAVDAGALWVCVPANFNGRGAR